MKTSTRRIAVWVLGAMLAGAGWSAERKPPDNPNDPCSPNYPGPPPFVPCEQGKPMTPHGKPVRPSHPSHAQKLYPAPDGKGDACTVPWTTGESGKPYCRGEIVE